MEKLDSLPSLLGDVATAPILAIPSETSNTACKTSYTSESSLTAPNIDNDYGVSNVAAFIENHSNLKMACSILNAYGSGRTIFWASGGQEGTMKMTTIGTHETSTSKPDCLKTMRICL